MSCPLWGVPSKTAPLWCKTVALPRLRALFSHGILFAPQFGERVGALRALGGEKVRVGACDVDSLVAHALGDVEGGEAHVNEQAHVAVAKVVNASSAS